MSLVKSKIEIEKIRKSAQITSLAMKKILNNIKIGVSTLELDAIADSEIKNLGGSASFKTVKGYKHTICTTVNEEVVHGVPNSYKLGNGDIIGVDIGSVFDGYHSDMAETVAVGKVDDKTLNFLKVGKLALNLAIDKAMENNRVGDISFAIQSTIEKAGYSVVHELTGHGVGQNLHEEPTIPCFGKKNTGITLKAGMVLAIEVIYTMGNRKITYKNDDGWTISANDGSLGGLCERTVLVTKSDPIVLTKLN
jgi:methionyl aminopeptidase